MIIFYRQTEKKWSKIQSLFIFFFLISASPNFAQKAPEIEWQKFLGGSNYHGNCIVQTSNGGYVIAGVAGSDVSGNHGGSDIWAVKLDASGSIQWQKCLGGSGDEWATCIIQTLDGGYAITGAASSKDGDVIENKAPAPLHEAWIVKLDSAGTIQWAKCYNNNLLIPSGDGVAWSITQDTTGEYIIAGQQGFKAEGCHFNTTDAFVIKLDSSGNLLWQRCFGGYGPDEAQSIIKTLDGGYAFGANTSSNDGDVTGFHLDSTSDFSQDYWLVKLNAGGSMEWQKALGSIKSDYFASIVQTADSGFVAGGNSGSNNGDVSGIHGAGGAWIVKVNSKRVIQWQNSLGGKFSNAVHSMIKTSDGGFIFTGATNSNDGDVSGWHPSADSTQGRTRDVWVVKLNATGSMEWQKCLGGSGEDEGWSIIETKDGGYAISGNTDSQDGDVSDNHGKQGIWIVKLKGTVNRVESTYHNGAQLNYFQVYPNPSSEQVHLQMWGNQTVRKVTMYDILGREISSISTLNGNTATVNVQTLMQGIYIAKLAFSYKNYTGSFMQPILVQH